VVTSFFALNKMQQNEIQLFRRFSMTASACPRVFTIGQNVIVNLKAIPGSFPPQVVLIVNNPTAKSIPYFLRSDLHFDTRANIWRGVLNWTFVPYTCSILRFQLMVFFFL
jgi:hypothetical protein